MIKLLRHHPNHLLYLYDLWSRISPTTPESLKTKMQVRKKKKNKSLVLFFFFIKFFSSGDEKRNFFFSLWFLLKKNRKKRKRKALLINWLYSLRTSLKTFCLYILDTTRVLFFSFYSFRKGESSSYVKVKFLL